MLYWNQHQHQVLEGCSWSLSVCNDDPPSLTSWMWTGSQLWGHLKEIYIHYTNCHQQIKHLRWLIQWGGLKTYRGSPTSQGITALYSTITFITSLVLGEQTAKQPVLKWQESTACVKLCACKSVFCIKRDGGTSTEQLPSCDYSNKTVRTSYAFMKLQSCCRSQCHYNKHYCCPFCHK